MSVPTIDPESSILSYPQWLNWEHQFAATGIPYDWAIHAGAFPTGMRFQPSWSVTGTASSDDIALTAHGFADGTALVFRTITGGAGLVVNTIYYVNVIDADNFGLAATIGGDTIDFTTNITAGTLYRPGFLTGAATVPGISTVRLVATNGDGDSAEVLFTIGIESAAAAPDSNIDVVWNFATNDIIVQTTSTLSLTPIDRDTPIIFVKEQDDLITRIRLVKSGSILDLGDPVSMFLRLKELEPEGQVVVSDGAVRAGTGDSSSYLIHAKFTGAALVSSLSNYEADGGTFYDALAEFEFTFANPGYAIGPETFVRTSKTFRIRIERDLND
ncbi:MAG: hypothetical protein P4L99_28150 [Chthoniobacter sp.]|nr:hypothetical protein [Chthoniobacter sp.]